MISIEFVLTSLVVIIVPGTGVIYTLAVGLGRGFRPSIAAAFGCTLGIIPAALASIFGLAAIFHTSAFAFQIIKYLGAAYLLYMAWSIAKEGGTFSLKENRESLSLTRVAVNGTLLNVLNPKLSLFFLAFLPQFVQVNASQNTMTQMIILAGMFMALTFLVFILYGYFATLARDYMISRPSVMAWVRYVFAAVFGYLGLRLAVVESTTSSWD